MRSTSLRLRHWLALAAVIRFIAAWTHARWDQPDEWYQTIELSNLLLNGFATYSREISLHLRNLTWPAMLTGPLGLAHVLSPDSIHLRIFFCQLFAGAIDLGAVWGFWRTLRAFVRKYAPGSSPTMFALAMALYILPWFAVGDAVSLSGEHLATSAAWIALGLAASGRFLPAGVAIVAIGAFKYPAFLLSAAIAGCAIYRLLRTGKPVITADPPGDAIERPTLHASTPHEKITHLVAGLLLGLGLFGLADFAAYGRLWESFWMYAQYNLFTGLATTDFGAQSAWTYVHYFTYRLTGTLLPIGVIVVPLAWVGWIHGLRRSEPVAWAATLYGAAHLLVAHKEERFMAPELSLTIWLAASAALRLEPQLRAWIRGPKIRTAKNNLKRGIAFGLVAVSLLANSLFFLKALWGDTWLGQTTRFELAEHLRETPDVCAVVSTQLSSSALLPWKDAQTVPLPAMAYFESPRGERSRVRAPQTSLVWIEYQPRCTPTQPILLQLDRLDTEWLEDGCAVLPSGVLNVLPHSLWPWAARRGVAAGSWLRCPNQILALFRPPRVEHPLARGFGHLPALPKLGVDGPEFIQAAIAATPPPACTVTCNPIGH